MNPQHRLLKKNANLLANSPFELVTTVFSMQALDNVAVLCKPMIAAASFLLSLMESISIKSTS